MYEKIKKKYHIFLIFFREKRWEQKGCILGDFILRIEVSYLVHIRVYVMSVVSYLVKLNLTGGSNFKGSKIDLVEKKDFKSEILDLS